jgi:superfamily II DNA or RNA helicase
MVTTTKAPAITLRPYQEEAIAAINEAAEDGITRPLVSLPADCRS